MLSSVVFYHIFYVELFFYCALLLFGPIGLGGRAITLFKFDLLDVGRATTDLAASERGLLIELLNLLLDLRDVGPETFLAAEVIQLIQE